MLKYWKSSLLLFVCITTILSENQEKMKDIEKYKGYWLTKNDILWDIPFDATCEYFLCYNNKNKIEIENPETYTSCKLSVTNTPFTLSATHPYLKKYSHFLLEAEKINVGEIIKGHLVLIAKKNNQIVEATGIQIWALLDEEYAYTGELGISFENNIPVLRVWAPTAQNVALYLYKNANDISPTLISNMKHTNHGVWEIHGEEKWSNCYYLYEVTVFVPSEQKFITNMVTDPYSVSLSTNSTHSQIVNLDTKELKPDSWDTLKKPNLHSFSDISIYELHLRDFSIGDFTVPEKYRGTFMAFSELSSNGMKHLAEHAKYGLTHVHLLPIFDIATINENKSQCKVPIIPDAVADSILQQEAVSKVKDEDGYNWGYDPFHYGVPEGSYATTPDGSERVLEVRHMVKSLNTIGLRVVMDVVYNHTHGYGQGSKSVLEKIVPGYYYRLDKNGYVQNSSCCPDTASEHKMMEKLMIDTLVTWAKQYKIDGFRFDLMGHHTTDNLANTRKKLNTLTIEKDGVDGTKIYLYGEGWTFGSLHNILPHKNMDQNNAKGMGIGTFNDRMRDSLRGGNFEHRTKSDQGFINGLYYDYNDCPDNAETTSDKQQQLQTLLNYTNNVRVSLAGGLSDFVITNEKGKKVYGYEINYRGASSGYTQEPQECINYISAHDNYTLWDQICAKAPFHPESTELKTSSIFERVQMQTLGISCVLLGQGIPFIHAGSDMLRSKSGDGDSYNSGDWFNQLDFSYQQNNWGIGLPIHEKNFYEWDFWRPRLTNTNLKPKEEHILASVAQFRRFLAIRYSSSLFRLPSAAEIKKRVFFLNAESGEKQIPGVIAMSIHNDDFEFDKENKQVVIVWNANNHKVEFSHQILIGAKLSLHPMLLQEIVVEVSGQKKIIPSPLLNDPSFFDNEKGIISVPARSTIIYLKK